MNRFTKKFCFAIDRGGTFTDVYARVPDAREFRTLKLLSEDPENYEDAPREGIRRILAEFGIGLVNGLVDSSCIDWIRMGTTVATNALLERQGARTALITTKGFADLLQIGTQERPQLFDLKISKPELLYETVLEVDERLSLVKNHVPNEHKSIMQGISGEQFMVLSSPDLTVLRPQLKALLDRGISALAVSFMHAYSYPQHEIMVGQLARELGFTRVSLSSEVMPTIKIVSRGDTTTVDAYLTPHIQTYLNSFKKGFTHQLKDTNILFMQSDGGLVKADYFSGCRAILSGPAGGVVGYARTTTSQNCASTEQTQIIGFDMGGTSTDVSRYAGELELTFETRLAGVRIQAPQLDIRTVAAGGGSRLFFENSMFKVGPQSAGADPGPACYRKNGYPTITDANLVLGRIQTDCFPHIFGPNEDQPLDLEASRAAIAGITQKINACYATSGRPPLTVEQTALGFLQVANEVMVRPIREVSVMRGFDSKDHVLATFGGAGPQHACSIARILGIKTLFIHRFSGILSAYGLSLSDTVVEKQQPAAMPLTPEVTDKINQQLDLLQQDSEAQLRQQGIAGHLITTHRYLNLRYRGTDTAMMVEQPPDNDFKRLFNAIHKREFGFSCADQTIIVDDLRVRSVGKMDTPVQPAPRSGKNEISKNQCVRCYFDNSWQQTGLYDMDSLQPGDHICGPALIIQYTSTIVVEPGCTARITRLGDLIISVTTKAPTRLPTKADPVRLAIFANLFMSIAEQMGKVLQKTAISTNIKERLDFSCALFDPNGNLVANAPHVPVHLGAMSEAVQEQICRCPDIAPGDVLVANHPAAGGSHLPDITVITPVFSGPDIIFWVASRGHHADIGGISPGSMPPDSTSLAQEGTAILSCRLVAKGTFREQAISDILLAKNLYHGPDGSVEISGTRRLSDNLSDLKAQVAANQKGIDLIHEMVDQYGLEVVQAYMQHIQQAAEDAIRQSLIQLSRQKDMAEKDTITAEDFLDDGSPIRLALTIDRTDGSAIFDFSGTGSQLAGNLNAPPAITRSAILYCLRCLTGKDIPLNHGCLRPVSLHIPAGSLLAPSPDAAVVGGNVLTSQRIVDVILKAFGVAAASQGCMNNLTFGNDHFGYYETIGGGAGAGPDWQGQSGVHTHMTNTRITDPEIMERRYPVLVREFSIRLDSGGKGKNRGGNGLIRELEFLEPLEVSILSERRVLPPYGLQGGQPGKTGKNLLLHKNGRQTDLGGKNTLRVQAGDRLRIQTPGGGGFGHDGYSLTKASIHVETT